MPYERKFLSLKLSVRVDEYFISMFYSCVFWAKMNVEGVQVEYGRNLWFMGIGHYSMNILWNGSKFRVNIANKRIKLFCSARFFEKCILKVF